KVSPPRTLLSLQSELLDHFVIVTIPKRRWQFLWRSYLGQKLAQIFQKTTATRTFTAMALHPKMVDLGIVSVIIEHEVCFKFLACVFQSACAFFHSNSPLDKLHQALPQRRHRPMQIDTDCALSGFHH